MKVENLRSLIRESINEYIREIDNAGTKAGLQAKVTATEEAIAKREKMANMEGIDEAYHEMLDKGKMKEIGSEVKALKKSLTKLQNQLNKLNSKSEPKAEVVKDEVIDEMTAEDDTQLGEDKESELGGKRVPKKFKDSNSTDWIEDKIAPKGKFSDKKSKGYFEVDEVELSDEEKEELRKKAEQNPSQALPEGKLNESFLKMQKMAGVITEAQYNSKKKSLIENQLNENTKHSELKPLEDILISKKYTFYKDDVGFSGKATYEKGDDEISLFKDYEVNDIVMGGKVLKQGGKFPVRILHLRNNKTIADKNYNSINDAKEYLDKL